MNHITSVGLDVHARSIKACAFNPLTGEVARRSFAYSPAEVAEWILALEAPKAVYESGVTGFHLQRELEALGVDCVIGAVSKMDKPAAEKRKKTDRRDAAFLARQLALGTISEVHVPDPECEAAHDISRALADARDDVAASKQRLSKFLLRRGYVWDETNDRGQRKKTWTRDHWAWIESIEMAERAAQETLDYYIDRCKRAIEDKRELEAKVKSHAGEGRWKPTVDALSCLKVNSHRGGGRGDALCLRAPHRHVHDARMARVEALRAPLTRLRVLPAGHARVVETCIQCMVND